MNALLPNLTPSTSSGSAGLAALLNVKNNSLQYYFKLVIIFSRIQAEQCPILPVEEHLRKCHRHHAMRNCKNSALQLERKNEKLYLIFIFYAFIKCKKKINSKNQEEFVHNFVFWQSMSMYAPFNKSDLAISSLAIRASAIFVPSSAVCPSARQTCKIKSHIPKYSGKNLKFNEIPKSVHFIHVHPC